MHTGRDMKLLNALSVLSMMMLVTIAAQTYGDRMGLHLPWYFMHQMVLALVPMLYLLGKVLPEATEGQRLAFVATSGFFIGVSAIAEITAIEHRFWWFFTERDTLLGVQLGSLPIEEFIYYPLFLNLPLLFAMWLKNVLGPETETRPANARVQKAFRVAGHVLGVMGVALLVRALLNTEAPLDTTILPLADAKGALRYSAGPHNMGWTIVQLFGLSGTAHLIATLWTRLALRRMAVTAICCFPFFLFAELMACGRGWWVWNDRQVVGLFTWILPVESYSMYLTGAVLPPLVMEWVRPFFESKPAAQTVVHGSSVVPFRRRETA